ncbi:hypothetical protein SUDANB178_04969 [Streptomyces sp. enrichment culture]
MDVNEGEMSGGGHPSGHTGTRRQPAAPVDRDRLTRLLGDPGLAWLVDRVRRRMGREEPLTGPVTLREPTAGQRAAVERLLGRAPGAGRALSVRLDAVDAVLRRSGVSPDGLAAAVTALTGPVPRWPTYASGRSAPGGTRTPPSTSSSAPAGPNWPTGPGGCVRTAWYAGSPGPPGRRGACWTAPPRP